MVENDYHSKQKEIRSLRSELTAGFSNLLLSNIDHLRQFNSTLLTINIAVTAAIFAGLASDKRDLLFKSPEFARAGAIFFFVDSVLIVFLMTKVIGSDNRFFTKSIKLIENVFSASEDALSLYQKAGKSLKDFEKIESFRNTLLIDENEKNEKVHKTIFTGITYFNISGYLFIAGLVLVGLSLLI